MKPKRSARSARAAEEAPSTRPLRALFFANDGLGAGHVTRSLAVARALKRRARREGVHVELLLVTTSEADALLADEPIATVRFPAPLTARQSGLSDAERREIAGRVLAGAFEGMRPDLLVTDTFPEGPHGELRGLVQRAPRRALLRRTVRPERAGDELLARGLPDYELAIVPDDPTEVRSEELPIPAVRVPPITLFEADASLDRRESRARLGLPPEGRFLLVCSGGGGDPEGRAMALRAAEILASIPGGPQPVLAEGPLARGPRVEVASARAVREAPLQPLLAAFDGAVAAAGYNLAHELAKARLPAALYGLPRPFDDQHARALRFAAAGFARALSSIHAEALREAVLWMERAPRPSLSIEAGGADRAADALLRLVTSERRPRAPRGEA